MLRVIGKGNRDHRRRSVGEARRAGANQPLVVQERAAECRLEETIGEGVLPRQSIERQALAVPPAHHHPPPLPPRAEPVPPAPLHLGLGPAEAGGVVWGVRPLRGRTYLTS